ncbi:MAG: hypothetical protein Q8Q49_04770 [bacterium]|nr:hypothetical protein [bacterium]
METSIGNRFALRQKIVETLVTVGLVSIMLLLAYQLSVFLIGLYSFGNTKDVSDAKVVTGEKNHSVTRGS